MIVLWISQLADRLGATNSESSRNNVVDSISLSKLSMLTKCFIIIHVLLYYVKLNIVFQYTILHYIIACADQSRILYQQTWHKNESAEKFEYIELFFTVLTLPYSSV